MAKSRFVFAPCLSLFDAAIHDRRLAASPLDLVADHNDTAMEESHCRGSMPGTEGHLQKVQKARTLGQQMQELKAEQCSLPYLNR